jgi:hypothetical protein
VYNIELTLEKGFNFIVDGDGKTVTDNGKKKER